MPVFKGTGHTGQRLIASVAVVTLALLHRPTSAESRYPTYTLFEVPGATGTQANSINNRGDIAGFWTASPTCGCGGPNPTTFKAFLFSDGQFTPFDLPDSVETTALGINERGNIVGRYDDMTRGRHGYILERHGAYETFDLPDAITTSAIDINARGDIVGFIRRASDGKSVSFLRR